MSLVEQRGRHDLVVVSADGSSVVVSDDLTLPRVWTDGGHPADVSAIVAFLRARLEQPVTVLRCVRTEPRQDRDAAYRWWHCELSNPAAPLPRGWRWRPIDKRAPAVRQPADGREWQCPGWTAEAYAWIKTQLPRVEGIEQIRCWEFSHVARVRAASKTYFFKALPKSYAHEPPLTQALAESYPRLAPKVHAVNVQRRWMLTQAVPGTSLEPRITLEPWQRTVAAYANLQRAWSSRTDELRALGCRQTTLAQTHDQAAKLANLPWLSEAIHRLQAYDIPMTLDHGDFWPSNVFVTRTNARVIDWTDAAINHP
ncbi:MAG TPA: phosphotransferase, partial [Chloroflexota bacterium]|nr:phosphotransferase [Chloroflexota bacterium]